ncbi:MAG: cytochrome c [Bacteroidota bacterium]|nr:cytochrome c [Bacteroidota bacterium]
MKKIFSIILFLFFVVLAHAQASQQKIKASISRGEKVYTKVCLSCHMADGGGVPHMNPPLTQTSYILGDKAKIIDIVLHGLTIREPIDDEYYSNNMAPHTDLTDQEIADVLTYVRNSFGNTASAVSVAEVKAVRSKKK